MNIALIPARSGSKGVKNKNIIKIKNYPLIYYTIKEALKAKCIDDVYVSTDSKKIAEISKKYGAKFLNFRSKKNSSDRAPMINVVNEFILVSKKNKLNITNLFILQPTSPLRKSKHIDESFKKFHQSNNSHSLISVQRIPHNFVPSSAMRIKNDKLIHYNSKKKFFDRNQKEILFARNGPAIIILKVNKFDNLNLYGKKIVPYIMDDISSIDIDNINDLNLVKKII